MSQNGAYEAVLLEDVVNTHAFILPVFVSS